MRASVSLTTALVLAAFAALANRVSAAESVLAADTIEAITVERIGSRAFVHIDARGVVHARLSEPFRSADRSRIYLTLENAALPDAGVPPASLASTGLLSLTSSDHEDGVRFAIDAESLADYGVQQTDGGVVLWLETAQATKNAQSEPAALHTQSAPQRLDKRIVAYTKSTVNRLKAWVRATDLESVAAAWPLAVAALPILIGILLHSAHSTASARLKNRPSRDKTGRGDDAQATGPQARVWAARTMAAQGLDAASIAERTGLPRDATALLVRTERAAKAAAPGTNFPARASRPLAAARP